MIFILIENKILSGFWGLKQKYASSSRFLKPFYRFIHKGFQYETGSYLPLHTSISGPVNFPHGVFGVFISGDVKIGKNCTIFQQVTIGSNMLPDSKGFGAPSIGENCIIGAGAKVIGKVFIGNNCRIGANCIVTENIPDNCTVTLSKPVIVQKNNITNKIYSKSQNGWYYLENGEQIKETNPEIITKLENR